MTINQGGGAFWPNSWLGGLILYIILKFLYKIKQAFKQAKQASFRCKKFQASKLRLSGLACLLNSKSASYQAKVNFPLTEDISIQ